MLLGVIAVTSGVVVTVLCLRKREKKKTESTKPNIRGMKNNKKQ